MDYFDYPAKHIQMRYREFLLLFGIILLCNFSYGQNFIKPEGARSAAMGNASVMHKDLWGVYNNQAGIDNIKDVTIGAYFNNPYMIEELSVQAVALAFPLNTGVIATDFMYYGYTGFNEMRVGLAYGMGLTKHLSAGIQINYFNIRNMSHEYRNRGTPAGEAGLQYRLFQNFIIGAYVFNPTRANFSDSNVERLPTKFRLGASYTFSNRFLLAVEGMTDMTYDPVFKAGAEYFIIDKIYLRTGVKTQNPTEISFGLGFRYQGIKADIAFSEHPRLDYSTHIGLNYRF